MRVGLIGTMLVAILCLAGGCPYTTRSGLPPHVKTVEVHNFRVSKKVFYKGIETKLTRALTRRINQQPQVRAVNRGGDALLTGTIVDVKKNTLRESKDDRPATQRLTVKVEYTFSYTDAKGEAVVIERTLTNQRSSSAAGLYDVDRGEGRTTAEDEAVEIIAQDIINDTIGVW